MENYDIAKGEISTCVENALPKEDRYMKGEPSLILKHINSLKFIRSNTDLTIITY